MDMVGRDLKDHPAPILLPYTRASFTRADSGSIQPGQEHLEGWDIHCFVHFYKNM